MSGGPVRVDFYPVPGQGLVVEHVTPHTFRHTVATQLVRDPAVDLVTTVTFLGHARLDTTARYSRPSEEDLAKAAERLK